MSRNTSLFLWGVLGIFGALVLGGINNRAEAASFKSRISIQLSDHIHVYSSGDSREFILSDHLGTTKKIAGNDVDSLYFPYGQVYGDELPEQVPVGYTGQRRLPQTSTMYYKARFYNPELGIFIQPDKVAKNADSYAYVSGDPISHNDPTGNLSCRMCGKFNPFFTSNDEKFPDQKAPITGVGSFLKANVAGFLSSIGVLGFLPKTSLNQYISKNENMNNFMMATAPAGVMSFFSPRTSIRGQDITVEGIAIPVWQLRKFNGQIQHFEVNTARDSGLQLFYNHLSRAMESRGRYESRASIVQRLLENKVDYNKAAEREMYAQGLSQIGAFYSAGKGVCLEFACLSHLGLNAAGKSPSYLILADSNRTLSGHAWAMFMDTNARDWFVLDIAKRYLGPINSRRDIYLDKWTGFRAYDMTRKP